MFSIFNMAVMPVCSKCRNQMQTDDLNFDDQSAVVTCVNSQCEEYNHRYRVVIPTMQGEPVYAS